MRVATDTGGTFTDVVADDGRIGKVLSTREDPSRAVVEGVDQLGAGPPAVLGHGTTVATNALLERRGARIALVTNAGFTDVIEIGRQDRPSLYDQFADRPEPVVAGERRYGVAGRLDANGVELEALDLASLDDLPTDVEAAAVSLLHADLNPAHEQTVAAHLGASGVDVTCSHEVSPEFREYERTVTTTVNAYLRPTCRAYLERLSPLADDVLVMTSAGGLIPVDEASGRPVALLLSGPAGGVRAGAAVAVANGYGGAVTFDMGGTSTDVCLVLDGEPAPAAERTVGGLPIRMPALDVVTIGAGGGSIAFVDAGGALAVGPRSAGASPGPACYGRGGTQPTVTDANLVLGRIRADATFPALGRLDRAAAVAAVDSAGVEPEGVVRVVNANMERALRRVTVERGVDPRGKALVAFGGAGPLHACDLAASLGMDAVIVPARAGVLSAVGILAAPRQDALVRSWPTPSDHSGIAAALAAMAADLVPGDVTTALDCRYEGQSHELTVPSVEEFHAEHQRRNGYVRPEDPVEVVALRATSAVASPVDVLDLPADRAAAAAGPTVVERPDCTVWVPEGWSARPGEAGALVIER